MKVEVRLFATLAAFLPTQSRDGVAELEIPEGSMVDDVARLLGIPADLARVVLVNGRDVGPEQPLAARDTVTIFPPLAGGAAYVSRESVANGTAVRRGSIPRSAAACSIAESISAPTSNATPLQ